MLKLSLRRYWPTIPLAAFLAWAVLWEWSSATAPHQPNESTTESDKPQSAVNNKPSVFLTIGAWADTRHDAIEAIAAGVSAFFAVILTGSTIGLWVVTRTAANAAKAAAESLPMLERAYVFFSEATGDITQTYAINVITLETDERGRIINAAFRFKNHGRTPAIVTHLKVTLDYVEKGFPDKPTGGELPSHLVVSSQETSPSTDRAANVLPGRITVSEYENATAKIGRIFFWGRLAYLDVFSKPHETGICAEWNFSENRFVVSKNKELNYYT